MLKFLSQFGHTIISLVVRFGESLLFLFKVLRNIPLKRSYWGQIIYQIYFVGVFSLVIIIVSGAFIGMVVALQGFHILKSFGAESQLSQLIALSVFRELGPVVGALLFAGRAGSALTAEIGLMQVTEQLTAMDVMAVNPLRYVAFPRLIAGIIAMPLLEIIFCGVAIYGGYCVSVYWLGIDSGTFMSVMKSGVSFNHDVVQGIVKSFVFGFVVSWVAIYHGFYTDNSSSSIGKATTKTVVHSSLAILALDFMLTAFMLGG